MNSSVLSPTLEPFGINLLDEAGGDVSFNEPGLSDDVTKHGDIVINPCSQNNVSMRKIRLTPVVNNKGTSTGTPSLL